MVLSVVLPRNCGHQPASTGGFSVRRFAIILFLAIASSATWAAPQPAESLESLEMKPNMDQRYATNTATRFLTNWH
jgi:hypothetical protein